MAEGGGAEVGCSGAAGCSSTQGALARSLADRVAQLPRLALEQLAHNVGRFDGGKSCEEKKGWGFARVPLEYAEEQGRFLETLRRDKWFNCPDCMDGMSEAFQVTQQMECLRGSVLFPLPNEKQVSSIKSLNSDLRNESKSMWSREAVLKGVHIAKMGEYSRARECYDQALDLNANNVDALVARGAAFANQSRYREAVNDFERALEIDPSHPNASDYLAATRQKLGAVRELPRTEKSERSQGKSDGVCQEGSDFDLESELQEAFAAVKRKHSRRDGSASKERRSHKHKKKRRRESSGHSRKSKKRKRRRSKSEAGKSISRSPESSSENGMSSD